MVWELFGLRAQLPKAANPLATRSGCKTSARNLPFRKTLAIHARWHTPHAHTPSAAPGRFAPLYSSIAVAQSIAVALSACWLTSLAPDHCSVPPQVRPRPRERCSRAQVSADNPRRAGGVASTHPPPQSDRIFPSPLSCVRMCPAPPVSTHPPLQLPCWNDTPSAWRSAPKAQWGPGSAWSYWGHSHQGLAFQAPADLPAPDTTPAATPLARLVMLFITAVTSVGPDVLAARVCPRLPPRHSFEARGCGPHFGGQNTEAPRYPSRCRVARLGLRLCGD